jgi:hypothetical protein
MTRVVEFHDFLFHDVLKCGREIIKKLLVFEKTASFEFRVGGLAGQGRA